MSLGELGDLGDFLGGIGVVVTLIYLAVQIRKNTRSVRAASLNSISTSISEFMDRVAEDPELTKLWFDGLSREVDLSETDNRRFALLLLSLMRRWENAFHQGRAGTLESAAWAGMREGLTTVFSSPGAQAWWIGARGLFSPEFVAFAERSIEIKRA
jgi:hypothetical protein